MPFPVALMVQGCTSDAGKSTLVAGLCRVFIRHHFLVAPFKPQNMALNSAVTEDGGEIGRAQALQAVAAKVSPSIHMNPVLLKPSSDTGAQVIIQGQSIGHLNAQNFHHYKPIAQQAVLDSFSILQQQYPIIFVEGAGSPAEVNLREGDIANMGFAEAVDCPVILIADIDKGGVFAHIIGTLACLSTSEQHRIKGFVINRFRGDLALLQDGLDWLEAKTGKPVLGVLPYLHDLKLDAEDALDDTLLKSTRPGGFKVICPLLPHFSNHTDLDPLALHPDVDLVIIKHLEPIPSADLIILPGSKNIAFDLNWLKEQGWDKALQKHLRYGGKMIGICGGLQMLGQHITDPLALESSQAFIKGLGLMPYSTELQAQKQLKNRQGTLNLPGNPTMSGYEIHQGITHFEALPEYTKAIQFNGEPDSFDGMISDDQQILVSYCHGLFDHPAALNALLDWAGMTTETTFDIQAHREAQLNQLADTLEAHLDMKAIRGILNLNKESYDSEDVAT
jgi:adenosylcobyric acid synthase